MTKTMNIASVQLNPIVGDLDGNFDQAEHAYTEAKTAGADMVVFPETVILGYPGEDLQLKPSAVRACMAMCVEFAKLTMHGPAAIFSSPWFGNGTDGEAGKLYNAVLFMQDGQISDVRFKHKLPNYGVFDEARVFVPGPLPRPVVFKGVTIGLPICEDIWHEGVCEHLATLGAELFIVPNGSPWRRNAHWQRETVARARIKATGIPIIYVNQVGGQDELAFDGASFSLDHKGEYVQTLPAFENHIDLAQWQQQDGRWICQKACKAKQAKGREADWRAMATGLGDYVRKNGFSKIVLGMSGGIDSAMAATIAVDTLGAENVWCVMLPSKYTSDASLEDAKACANALGCKYDIIPIGDAVQAFGGMLADLFAGLAPDTTEENLQSRIRAVVLMALSNKFGHMLITTGNKSEMAVGYATLYGDMCGGYNPLKDLYKTEVFSLMRWRNRHTPDWVKGGNHPVPERILTKPPSAELRDDQTDQDSLPPYDILDDILRGLVDSEISLDELVARGHKPETLKRIEHLLYINEYKRNQAPPGVKLGNQAFGRDRRYPLTNKYRDTITNKDD
ncbi:MAG TPA: NAD+ synthase [Hellea balneolensis]|uniref:Glutamine-dependent NAD(+) synthetase n=1 Tax=Hellea balneolensis TaxID=287478 RepID=A0A7C5R0B2_9PROT|nr:NAD+ synthase [Hellea balneolensis]